MLLIKDAIKISLLFFIFYQVAQCKSIKRFQDADYDADGDYFEPILTVQPTTDKNLSKEISNETTTEAITTTHNKSNSQSNESNSSENLENENDDGVTCSPSNVTEVLSNFEVENTALVIFKVNSTENVRELLYFLNLAKRFCSAPSVFLDHRFIVLTIDNSSDVVNEFIDKNNFLCDIIVIDEDEYPDLGFVIDLDELHAYVVDQCGKLAYIIVPPWSSAQQPFIKAALISTIIDLPCECPASQFSSAILAAELASLQEVTETTTISTSSTSDSTISTTLDEFGEEDIENIEELLDNQNRVDESFEKSENFNVPLRIIIPSVHVHFDENSRNYYKYDEIILRSDDENYHNHYDSGDKLLDISDERLQAFTDKIFVGNNSFGDIKAQFADSKILVNRLGNFYKILKEQNKNVFDVDRLDFDVLQMPPSIQIFGVQHHYKQLNKWILYKI